MSEHYEGCPAHAGQPGGHRYGYARVSTLGQDIEPQLDQLRAWGCCRIFQDKGVSGTLASRPDYDRLLAQVGPGDQIMATKLDRFGRTVKQLVDDYAKIDGAGAYLVVPPSGIDTRHRMGKLMFQFLAIIAELEHDLLMERLEDRMQSVRGKGNMRRAVGGPPPLGFYDPGGDGERDWGIDPIAAAYLADAADRVLNPRSGEEGLAKMHAALRKAHPEMAGVSARQLRTALRSPQTGGWIVWHEDPELRVAGKIGGPLDADIWYRLHRHYDARKTGRPAMEGRYPMGPLLRCGKCGNQLSGDRREKRRGGYVEYYACRNPHPGQLTEDGQPMTRACRGVAVPRDDVDQLFKAAYEAWALSPAGQAASARTTPTDERRAELTVKREERIEWLDSNDRLRRRGRRTAEVHRVTQREIEDELDEIDAELEQLAAIDAEPAVLDPWDDLTPAEKRRMAARAVQTPVTVRPGRGGNGAPTAAERMTLLPAPQ
ncbi:MAG: recombinase family protein [Actinobacteria bacterium]|nr:recombinase family protein [Actinomycetota bacterium]